MKKIAVIVLGGVQQQKLFWPHYLQCKSGCSHDLILVHRDYLGVPNNPVNLDGKIIMYNKIIGGKDIPHKAFGAYRHYFYEHQNDYDFFVFVSDDVVIKRDNWLKDIVSMMNRHPLIGFGASQIFNGHKKYPHESHLRAPFWFAKTEVLKKIKWKFDSDHDGEMKIGDQCASVGYVGVQVGNKVNLAYDATEPYHITQILEKKYFLSLHPFKKHTEEMYKKIENYFYSLDQERILEEKIISPYSHIGEQNVFIDIEPFDGLIYYPSLDIASKYNLVRRLKHGINLLC